MNPFEPRSICRVAQAFAFTFVYVWGTALAHAQSGEWIRQFGTANYDEALAVFKDPSGVYAAGRVDGNLSGIVNAGNSDAFIRKYDAGGNELWTRLIGTAGFDMATAVASDASGVYVTGHTQGALQGHASAGNYDVFVAKFDSAGALLWTRQFGSPNTDFAHGIFSNGTAVFVVGTTFGALPGQQFLGGIDDAFIRKYDVSGNELWTRQFGTSSVDVAWAIAGDASGIYVAGTTSGPLSDPGETGGAYLRKYDESGNVLWTRQSGLIGSSAFRSVAVSGAGVYVAGQIHKPDFSVAVVLRRYDPEGNMIWEVEPSTQVPLAIAASEEGVFTSGYTFSPLITLPGTAPEVAVHKYDHAGAQLWRRELISIHHDQGNAIAVDPSGVYVAGRAFESLEGQPHAGGADAFVAKLSLTTPAELLVELISSVDELNLKQGIASGLDAKLAAALQALSDLREGNNAAAIGALTAFISLVEAQRGRTIEAEVADTLIGLARQIIAVLEG